MSRSGFALRLSLWIVVSGFIAYLFFCVTIAVAPTVGARVDYLVSGLVWLVVGIGIILGAIPFGLKAIAQMGWTAILAIAWGVIDLRKGVWIGGPHLAPVVWFVLVGWFVWAMLFIYLGCRIAYRPRSAYERP